MIQLLYNKDQTQQGIVSKNVFVAGWKRCSALAQYGPVED